MDDSPPRVRQYNQHEEHLEADRRHGEEVEGNELRQVGFQEDPPGRRGRRSMADAIRLNRGFRHGNDRGRRCKNNLMISRVMGPLLDSECWRHFRMRFRTYVPHFFMERSLCVEGRAPCRALRRRGLLLLRQWIRHFTDGQGGNSKTFGPVVARSSSTDPLPYGSTIPAPSAARRVFFFDGIEGSSRGPPQPRHSLPGL